MNKNEGLTNKSCYILYGQIKRAKKYSSWQALITVWPSCLDDLSMALLGSQDRQDNLPVSFQSWHAFQSCLFLTGQLSLREPGIPAVTKGGSHLEERKPLSLDLSGTTCILRFEHLILYSFYFTMNIKICICIHFSLANGLMLPVNTP